MVGGVRIDPRLAEQQVTARERLARAHYVDWLRVIAVLLLIPYHTARVFDIWDSFYAKNAELSGVLTYAVVAFLNIWQIPLLFLLAGAAAWFALGRRTPGQFLQERGRRLLLPLAFGLFVIVPPQAYLARLQYIQGYSDSYPRFLLDYFRVRGDLTGYSGLFTPGHLWFVGYLLVISLAAPPLVLLAKQPSIRRWGSSVAGLIAARPRIGTVLVLAAPVVPLFFAGALPAFSGKNLFVDLTLFVLGFVLVADSRLVDAVEGSRLAALVLALAGATAVIALEITSFQAPKYSLGDVLSYLLNTWTTWLYLVALLGFGRHYLSSGSRLLGYANEAAYPFYILHQTAIVLVAHFVVLSPASVAVKFVAIAFFSLAATLASYDLLVRRVGALRFLFGVKPRSTSAGAAEPTLAWSDARRSATSMGRPLAEIADPRHPGTPAGRHEAP